MRVGGPGAPPTASLTPATNPESVAAHWPDRSRPRLRPKRSVGVPIPKPSTTEPRRPGSRSAACPATDRAGAVPRLSPGRGWAVIEPGLRRSMRITGRALCLGSAEAGAPNRVIGGSLAAARGGDEESGPGRNDAEPGRQTFLVSSGRPRVSPERPTVDLSRACRGADRADDPGREVVVVRQPRSRCETISVRLGTSGVRHWVRLLADAADHSGREVGLAVVADPFV
jgi:hypothetical protein